MDQYAAQHGIASRSGVLRRALSLLRGAELENDYAAAWDEWPTGDAAVWDMALADGLDDHNR
jgi:hypothetical protein